jgi:hypothetical protein
MPRSTTPDPLVVIAAGVPNPLACALERVDAWSRFEVRRRGARVKRVDLPVVILTSFERFVDDPPGGGGAALVERLVDLLQDHGYANVGVVGASGASASWFENRDVVSVADLTGFGFQTPAGRMYDITDLGDEPVLAPFPPDSCLHGHHVGAPWLTAGVRIVVAPCGVDLANGYRSVARQLATALAAGAIASAPRVGGFAFDPVEVARDVVRVVPPDLCIVDAIHVTTVGAGSAVPVDTVIAATTVQAADLASATMLGVDPYADPAAAGALRDGGIDGLIVDGDLRRFPGVSVPADSMRRDSRRLRDVPGAAGLFDALTTRVEQESFPPRHAAIGRVNRAVTSGLHNMDGSPLLELLSRYLAWAGATSVEAVDAFRALTAKDRLRPRVASLGVDLRRYGPDDYESIPRYLAPAAAIAAAGDRGDGTLRWRYVDDAVLFQVTSEMPVDFESWCARVDIARSISLMADYLGGRSVPVTLDASGRVVHQAERNLYLAQPNYLALAGAPPIDVVKIELIRYTAAEHTIWWRTVGSPNGSAELDDGIVRFCCAGRDRTLVTILGLQRFVLPPFWQLVDVGRLPELKDRLVDAAYQSFFGETIENLWQEFLGERRAIGSAGDTAGDSGDRDDGEQLGWRRVLDWLDADGARSAVDRLFAGAGQPQADELDAEGFHHARFVDGTSGAAPQAGRLLSGAAGSATLPVLAMASDLVRASAVEAAQLLTALARAAAGRRG